MVNELFKKNKVIMDRDNIIRELRTKLSEAESERDSLKTTKILIRYARYVPM
jgi:predicted RNase H-like nuclease (RuvC/YqgF family)